MIFVIFLASCVPGVQPGLPTDSNPVSGTDNPELAVTGLPNIFTQTPETVTSLPDPNVATLPSSSSGLKPPNSESPAAGICQEAQQGDLVSIVLGIGADGIPLAGRCMIITPSQRIKLINQSSGPFNLLFGEYQINLPVGSDLLLKKPAGQYLAPGIHSLPNGPELWVKETVAVTESPLLVGYTNREVGYRLSLPADWQIDESGMINSLGKQVTFSPPSPEPFIAYLLIGTDSRTLDQIINLYSQSVPDASREDTILNGYAGIKYTYTSQNNVYRIEYYIPYKGQIILIATDRPNDSTIQSILMTVRFVDPPQPVTYDATMTDNGKTFVMNVGDKLSINLDLGYVWSTISISNPAVIAGAGDGYFAFAGGTATLTTTGNPECLNLTPPCGMPSILFTVTVIVP